MHFISQLCVCVCLFLCFCVFVFVFVCVCVCVHYLSCHGCTIVQAVVMVIFKNILQAISRKWSVAERFVVVYRCPIPILATH